MDNARLEDVPRSSLVNFIKRRIYANVDAIFIPAPSHVSVINIFGEIAEEQMFYGVNAI